MCLGLEIMATLPNEKHSKQVTDPRHRHRSVRRRYGVVTSIIYPKIGCLTGESMGISPKITFLI